MSSPLKETEYQASYRRLRAFVKCTREATHAVGELPPTRYAGAARKLCLTQEGPILLLCTDCAAFWTECKQNADHGTWEAAVFLRGLPSRLRGQK